MDVPGRATDTGKPRGYHPTVALNDIIVKISIARHEQKTDAEGTFKQLRTRLKAEEQATSKSRGKSVHLIKEDLSSIGDEGLVLDVRGSEAVAFRKGRFTVRVSVPSPTSNKDVFFSRKFADDVAKALE